LKSRQQLISVNGMNLHRLSMIRKSSRKARRSAVLGKQLNYEMLEPRLAMAGLVAVGTQPEGVLSGKIVYMNGGHGITANSSGVWGFQRPLLLNMIEDLGNQDQMSMLADSAFRAGATVVPFRPVGHQSNEIVLDNDNVEVTFSGSWTDSTSSIYFGDVGDVPYRFATASATETAVATYRPNVVEAGFYPVYCWTRAGTDRVEQLYRVNHSGGSTEVTVDHRMVGTGLVYLGTYYFEAGNTGSVEISNKAGQAGVVIADMIRFGNGVGDIDRGAGISGRDREDEAALYWIKWHVDHSEGISESSYDSGSSTDQNKNVSAPTRYAAFMNQSGVGSIADRVYVGFHTNASANGTSRGVLGLYNSTVSSQTPNQVSLADILGTEINDDLLAQDGQFEHNWVNDSTPILGGTFGEINNSAASGEFDATIVEVAYHDNQLDAELLRDADFRAAAARATLQGVVRFFNSIDGGETPLVMAPGKATGVTAEAVGLGNITVSWVPPAANSYNGDAATGYMVYGSTDGYGFDGGTFVAGGASSSYTYTGLDAEEGAHYFKVVPVNAGGAAPDSEVVASIANNGPKSILIVNGFDRLSRQQNPVQSGAERVRPRQSNSYDYAVQIATGIEVASPDLVVDTASNEAVISGAVNLSDYQAVVWILGEESTADDTFNSVEVSLVTDYLTGGGQLFATGSELAFEFGAGNTFLNNQLHVNFVSDDANTYNVNGSAGSIFEGLSFSFDNGAQFYNVDSPDVITTANGSTVALNYSTGATAGIQYDGGPAGPRVVMFGFPVETITNSDTRNQVIARVLGFFDFELEFQDVDLVLDNDDGPAVYTETGTWTLSGGIGYNGGTYKFSPVGFASTATWQFHAPFAGQGEVFVQYVAGANRASSTTYQIETGNGTENVSIDQKSNSLTWVSLGNFDFTAGNHTIVLNSATSSGGSVVIADAVRIVIPVPVNENADFDGDGDVDGRDFLQWQRGFGITGTATQSQGDANNDSDVDAADLAIWQSQYEGSQAVGQVAAAVVSNSPNDIPEPDLLTLSGITDLNPSLFTRRASNLTSPRAYSRHAEPFFADGDSRSNPILLSDIRTTIAELENSLQEEPLKRGDAEMLWDLAIEDLMLSEFR
jgi:hypothetical protein